MFDPNSISYLKEEARLRVIRTFSLQLDQYSSEMETAFRQEEWGKIEKIAHQVKGSSLIFKATSLAEICSEMEKKFSKEMTGNRQELFDNFIMAARMTRNSVRQYLTEIDNALK